MDQAPVASRAMPIETRRHRDDPARPVSMSFFERDLVGFQETPDRADRCAHPTLLTQPGLHRMQGQIVLRRDQCQQPSSVLILDPRVGRAAHRLGRGGPRVQPATPPVHYRRDAHRKTGGCRPAARARLNRCDHTLPQILRIGSSHPCWPPSPAQSMNHKSLPNGIPVRFSLARKWSRCLIPNFDGAFYLTNLTLLWQFRFDGVGEEFLTVGASPWGEAVRRGRGWLA